MRGVELRAAEGSRAERLGGPGQASGAETSAERRRTCAFDTLAVSSVRARQPLGSSRAGGAEACPSGSLLGRGPWTQAPPVRAGPGTTVSTALTVPSSPSEVWPTRGTCERASPGLPEERRRPGRGSGGRDADGSRSGPVGVAAARPASRSTHPGFP